MSQTPETLLEYLGGLGIRTKTFRHPALFTVSDSQSLRGEIAGAHTKNLFLKDKKDSFFLVTVEENARVDLKTLHQKIGAASRLSFGKPEKLVEFLGVEPGSVTVFGVVNDETRRVKVVLDADLMEYDIINAHPLTNEATTSIGRDDLLRFLQSVSHEPLVLKVTD